MCVCVCVCVCVRRGGGEISNLNLHGTRGDNTEGENPYGFALRAE